MSKTIDERVVEMRFDNKQFESNVQTSLSTIEKLKKSLDMDGATKGLESIDSAAKKVDMSGLGSAVETVKTRFSALEIMAVTALANITNSVVNTGKQMLHSLTIEPISQGFEEYELKMGSIQTIMMSTGASLEEVNKYLQELNTYSDKTIYSFQDMTSNIGKFTNAGVGLEDAVMAIQGVSNVAAVSGANANEASRAMYNFAQALSAGYVKLIDWKSIEYANMATVEFKTQLLESAVACGTLTKTADGMYKTVKGNVIDATHGFNDSLQDQWMTTEALVGTLRNYADETTEIGAKAFAAAQDVKTFTQLIDTLKEDVGSGWANTWEILFGDFEEAKELWTGLRQVIGGFIDAQADARNKMLQGWKDLGGRTKLIEALKNAFEGVQSVIKPIYEAFREIFPPTTAQQLYDITENLRKFTANLKLSDTASANLKSTFKGLFAILDIVKQAFSAIFTAIKPLFGGFGTLGDGILGFTGGIGDAIVAFDEFIKTSGAFQKVGEGIATVIQTIMTALSTLKNKIKEKFESANFELFHSLLERIHERMTQVGEAAGEMKSGVIVAFEVIGEALANCQFVQLLSAVWNAVKTIGSGIVKILGELGSSLAKNLGEANFSGIIDLLNGISFGAIAVGITKFVGTFRKAIEDIGSFKESFIGILDSVRGCFEAYQTQLQAGTLLKIASAIAILTASLIALSLVDSEKLNVALGAITVLFAELLASMAVFNKISGQATGVMKSVTAMLGIATAVLILASALKKIADLDAKQLTTGLIGVAGLTTMMVAAAKAMSSNSKTIIKGATQMVIFAAAIKILASVCEQLAKLDWNQLAKGLVGVGVLLAEVSLFLRTAKFSGKSITTATGIVILSAAIKVLASACKDFGEMKWEEIGNGLASIAVLLAEVTAFTKLTGNASGVDVAKLSGVVVEFRNLVDLANGIKSVDTSGMSTFAQNLTNLGNAGIDGFINAFTNANFRVSTAANTMVTTFINAAKAQQGNLTSTFTTMINGIVTAFTSKYSQFTIMGQTMMTNFISGIRTGDASARSAFVAIVSGCLTAIRNKFYEFNTVGQTTMTNLIAGIRTKNQLAKDAFVQIINSCLTAIRNKYTDFYNAGKYLVEGFAAGITANTYMAEARARAAAAAAEAELDINSPSKVGYRIGGFFGMGFVNSLIDYTDKSYDAGASVAKSAKEGLRNAVSKIGDFIENGIDSQPTIRPLLDLSDVTEGAGRLSALLSRNQAMKISAGMERESGSVVQNGGATPTSGNNYNFTQNNYSPKALSRIDIYRQTKNQFSALKGLVET